MAAELEILPDDFTALDHLRNPFLDAMIREGIDEGFIISKIKTFLEAKKITHQKLKGSSPQNIARNAEIIAETDTETLLEIQNEDYSTQLAAIEKVINLAGGYPSKKIEFEFNADALISMLAKLPEPLQKGVAGLLEEAVKDEG